MENRAIKLVRWLKVEVAAQVATRREVETIAQEVEEDFTGWMDYVFADADPPAVHEHEPVIIEGGPLHCAARLIRMEIEIEHDGDTPQELDAHADSAGDQLAHVIIETYNTDPAIAVACTVMRHPEEK